MALPEQIRKQTEAVQELYKQLNVGQESGEETPQADDPVTPVESSAADEPAPNDPVAPSPAPEQKTGDDKAPEDFAQKYKTLQGMYNAEVPRLHQRIQQMEQLLASLSSQPTPAASAPAAATATPPAKLVTEKDVEEYGDAIDMMRKVTKEEMNAVMQRMSQLEGVLQQFQSNVVPQVQAVAQKQAVTAEQQFWADLTSTVSNWREVNDNQAFQAWLLEMDPLTGITRQTYLEDAQRALDARRVSAFFRTWLESTGQANVAQTQGSSPAPAAKSELEKQVTPGRARSAGTPQTNKGKVYTPEDIKKFFNDVRSGKYRGREQERDRIERDIFTAQRENRIQVTA
jgi:hypothetical protein